MTSDHALSERAAELRRSFDRGFAEPRQRDAVSLQDLLSIRVAGVPYVARLDEITGLYPDKMVTPLPSPLPELLGIAGFRGVVVPVYDLRVLLGSVGTGTPRWMVTAGGANPVALAFDVFDGHLRIAGESIAAQSASSQAGHVREVLRIDGLVRPFLSIPSILSSISERARYHESRKEQ